MKAIHFRSWVLIMALLGLSAMQSHAVLGIGIHWAPAPVYAVKSDTGTIAYDNATGSYAKMKEGGVTGLQGFGLKFWVDALPLIDIEATTNFQYGYYDVDVITKKPASNPDTTRVTYNPPFPILEGKPVYARAYGDFSILYPFLKLPPLISILKIYAGGGITYGASTIVLNHAFAKNALDNAGYNAATDQGTGGRNASAIITDALSNKGVQYGFGGFAQLGAHVKPPIIPIALYVDFKYHFLGFSPDLADNSGLTMELGGALAF